MCSHGRNRCSVQGPDLMTRFFLFNPLVRSVLGISLMIDVGLYVNPAFGWKLKRLKSKKCHEPGNVAHLCGTQAGFLCDVSTEILMLLFAIPFISKANARCLPRLLGHFCFKAGHNSTLFLYIYIRIIKNLSPRRMLISHWSLESIWTPKTSKPCLKPEDKHVSLGVFVSVNEWWQKVSL